jgi:GNAT superfamily N-acetyltransferase
MMSTSIIISLSKDVLNIDAILIGITHIHASCIEHDHTEATFLPPLSYSTILQWWHERFEDVIQGRRYLWVELQPVSSRRAELESPFPDNQQKPITLESHPDETFEVAGLVALSKPTSQTGAFRGEVEKLLVSPNHRQKGIAKRLMAELERLALNKGIWNLLLDTEVGSPAEQVYPRLGYIRVGVVPEYGYSPIKGKFCDEVWFYKDLRKGTL